MNVAQMLTPKVCTNYLLNTHTVRQGLEIMQRHRYTVMPVLDENGLYLGCLSEGDLLRHLLTIGSARLQDLEKEKVDALYRTDLAKPLNMLSTMQEVTTAVLQQNFVPIIDDRGFFCGLVTRRNYIECLAPYAYGFSGNSGDPA